MYVGCCDSEGRGRGGHNRTCSHIWEVALSQKPLTVIGELRCGLARDFFLTLSRSDRILNALGKQCESEAAEMLLYPEK